MPTYWGEPYWGEFVWETLGVASPHPVDRTPPPWLLNPHATVLIGGVVQDKIAEWHTDIAFDQIATADLTLPYPLRPIPYSSALYDDAIYDESEYDDEPYAAEIVEGASVEILAAAYEDDPEVRVFSGRINRIETSLGEDGRMGHLRCDGWAWALTLPLEREIAFAGGAPLDGRLLSSQVIHVGDDTALGFADPSPDGMVVDLSFTPAVDAHFVNITGRAHSANTYNPATDRDIKEWSRIEIWQAGRRLGYANMPILNTESAPGEVDYTDDAEWSDLDVTIGARIEAANGEITVRLKSGRRPGTAAANAGDDWEVKGLSYQIAGRQTARRLISALFRERGYGPTLNGVPYRVNPITDIAGTEILLGGNGLINNGQIVLPVKTQPWAWLTQTLSLWGCHAVDGPDALEVVPARGAPDDLPIVATYEDGVNLTGFLRTRDVGEVVNVWNVYGASGADERGEPFQYSSFVDLDSVLYPDFIPYPPGYVAGEVRSDLLVSDGLARSVREVKEVEFESIPVAFSFDTVPSPTIKPGSVVQVISAAEGIDQPMWVTGVRHDFDEGGFWTSMSVRVGTGSRNAEWDMSFEPAEQPVTSTRHIGNKEIAWYHHPDPHGLEVRYDWEAGGDYRGVRVTGRFHGANGFASGTVAETTSRIEIWQFGVQLASLTMPHHGESYARRLDYDNDVYWKTFDVTLAADVVDGPAEVRFTSGVGRDGTRDEYEVKVVTIKLYAEATEQGPVRTSGADWHAYQARRVYRWAS